MNRIAQYKLQLVRESSFLYGSCFVNSPEDAAELFSTHFNGLDRETFTILALNVKNKVIGIHDVSVGSLTASVVHPREVFKPLILMNAASVIVGHCHPSGETTPSREDIATTTRLVQAGKLLDIPVLDHIITSTDKYAEPGYTSLKENGIIK